MFKMGLKFKILTLILIFITTSAIILTYSTYKKLTDDIYQKNKEVFQTFTNIFLSEKEILIKKYSMSLDILLENRQLIEAFKKRDRDTVKTLITQLYETRLEHLYDIEQFQFHTPPATSFYRAHAPARYGDDLSAFRKTVLMANNTKQMVTGLEVGRAGLGLRVVKPVWFNYDFIGTVELGGGIENLLATPTNATGVEYALGIFTKSLQRSKFFYSEENRYTYKDMYMYNYSSNIIKSLITSGQIDMEGEIIKMNDKYYMVKNVPISDFSSDHIGYLLLSKDTTAEITAMHKELSKQIAIILSYAVTVVILLTIILVKLIFSPLEKITKHISEIPTESALPSEPLIIKGNSEISMLADAYNILNTRLQESFEKINSQLEEIQSINASLENSVNKRTKQLKDANTRLKNAMKEIQSADEAKSEFLASMSHELRTPMNAILGLNYLLMQTELSSKQYDYANKVKTSADMLLEIINNVLDFSKIESGKLELDHSPFSLKDIVRNTFDNLEIYIAKKDINLEVDIDPKIPDFLFGDPLRISQVLNNLSVNAAKFTHQGSIEINAKLMTKNDKYAKIKLTVTDTGIGIPKDKLPTLFESFTQVKRKNEKNTQGSGLGLSITKKILDAMNSEISVESIEDEGSTFTFSLTLEIASPEEAEMVKTDTGFGELKAPDLEYFQTNHEKLSGTKLLIVEDNDINLQVITEFAEILGLSYKTARNGSEALKTLEVNDFDLIFMDIIMPVMDGIEATKRIRQNSKTKNIPIFALTASTMPEEIESCRQAGMNGHIAKPVTIQDITHALKEYSTQDFPIETLTPASTDAVLPDEDDILEVESAVKQLNGNKKLYLELLEKFYSQYKYLNDKALEAIKTNEPEQMQRFFHTIKSVTKTLGATNVSTQCEKIEKLIKNNKNISESKAFTKFIDEVKELDKKLDIFFNSGS